VIRETIEKNKGLYQKINQKIKKTSKEKKEIQAIVGILAACLEHQVAFADNDHSLFTEFLLRVWNSYDFTNLEEFCIKIINSIPNQRQTPNLQYIGKASQDLLKKRKPFEI